MQMIAPRNVGDCLNVTRGRDTGDMRPRRVDARRQNQNELAGVDVIDDRLETWTGRVVDAGGDCEMIEMTDRQGDLVLEDPARRHALAREGRDVERMTRTERDRIAGGAVSSKRRRDAYRHIENDEKRQLGALSELGHRPPLAGD